LEGERNGEKRVSIYLGEGGGGGGERERERERETYLINK